MVWLPPFCSDCRRSLSAPPGLSSPGSVRPPRSESRCRACSGASGFPPADSARREHAKEAKRDSSRSAVEVADDGYDVAMDRDGFVDALNEDLKMEFRSIVQYVQHIAIIKGAEFMSTVDELRLHVAQELNHAL